jgi:hypothetical protein
LEYVVGDGFVTYGVQVTQRVILLAKGFAIGL